MLNSVNQELFLFHCLYRLKKNPAKEVANVSINLTPLYKEAQVSSQHGQNHIIFPCLFCLCQELTGKTDKMQIPGFHHLRIQLVGLEVVPVIRTFKKQHLLPPKKTHPSDCTAGDPLPTL